MNEEEILAAAYKVKKEKEGNDIFLGQKRNQDVADKLVDEGYLTFEGSGKFFAEPNLIEKKYSITGMGEIKLMLMQKESKSH